MGKHLSVDIDVNMFEGLSLGFVDSHNIRKSNRELVATLALARDQGKGVARLRAYK
jgi:hypothetical protein